MDSDSKLGNEAKLESGKLVKYLSFNKMLNKTLSNANDRYDAGLL